MYKQSDNPQVEYSLVQLTKALFHFLNYESFSNITVSQICSQANLTRRTFYRNCESKTDLILFSCDYLIKGLINKSDDSSQDITALLKYFFSYWYGHREFLLMLYRNGLFDLFFDRFEEICNRELSFNFPVPNENVIGEENKESLKRFGRAFILGGQAYMLRSWVEEDFKTSCDDLVRSISIFAPTSAWLTESKQ